VTFLRTATDSVAISYSIVKKGLPFALYLLLALVMTWPLGAGLTRDVPGDLGDSLLNLWILGWDAEQLPRVATGQLSWRGFWDANIFHPEPLALTFSEHLFGEAIQILPLYHLTGNLILCYNLLFLASFVLSGLGMYLLVRELLGEGDRFSGAAFVAGIVFAFVPFRIAQVAHIQSLNAQWMPLALYGFRRFIVSGRDTDRLRIGPLAGGSAALLVQNWSCGYYLIFFAPFVPLIVGHWMIASGRARDWRRWLAFAAAALVVAAGTWPFLSPYLEAQRVHGVERSIGEVTRFSADVLSYFTAPEALRLWGPVMQAYPKPEGELFFGLTPLFLALVALLSIGDPPTAATLPAGAPPTSQRYAKRPLIVRIVSTTLLAIIAVQGAGLALVLLTGGVVSTFAGLPIRATNAPRLACARSRIADRVHLAVTRPAATVTRPSTVRARSVWDSLRAHPGLRRTARAGAIRDDRGSLSRCRERLRHRVAHPPYLAPDDHRRGGERLVPGRGLVRADACQPDMGGRRRHSPGTGGAGSHRAPPVSRSRGHPGTGRARGISVRRSGVGAPVRLLLHRSLETPRQRLQRWLSAGVQSSRGAAAARGRGSRGGMDGAPGRRHDARHRARQRVSAR
jgi:hypothetical protein